MTKEAPPRPPEKDEALDQGQQTQEEQRARTWPKEARDAYLRKAQEAADYRKQLEEFRRQLEDIQSRVQKYEQDLQSRDALIASLSQNYYTGTSQPYGMPQPGLEGGPQGTQVQIPPSEDWDPFDKASYERYLDRKLQEMQNRLLQQYQADQQQKMAAIQYWSAIQARWVPQIAHLMRADPNLKPDDVYKLISHAVQTGTWDLDQAYQSLYRDRLLEQEKQRMYEEARKQALEELKKSMSNAPAPPVYGVGPVPLRPPEGPPPRNYREATQQALEEYRGKIITPE